MADFDGGSLSSSERAFLRALNELGVRYLIVGMSAALLQGARGATEDIDLWFEALADPRIGEAARKVGGVWVTRTQPPMLGGAAGDRWDVVTTMSGLPSFAAEYADSKAMNVDDVPVRVLPLARVIESKRVANRMKDRAVLPALEAAQSVIGELERAATLTFESEAVVDGERIAYLKNAGGEERVLRPWCGPRDLEEGDTVRIESNGSIAVIARGLSRGR